MKIKHTFIYSISLILFSVGITFAQDQDSVSVKKEHRLRVGIDISKPIKSAFDKDFTGLEIAADYQITKNIFAAVEIGYSDQNLEEDYFKYSVDGSYFKVGPNINVYKNWIGMNNEIYFGLRYAYSTFSSEVTELTVYQNGTYFDPFTSNGTTSFTNLDAHWAEVTMGIKTEVLPNLFLTLGAQLKRLLSSTEPENFKNLNIPGFDRVFANDTGVGFTYMVSYSIPLFNKKNKKPKEI